MNLDGLKTLELRTKSDIYIEQLTLINLDSLRKLDLSGNRIKELNIRKLASLTDLNLSERFHFEKFEDSLHVLHPSPLSSVYALGITR